MNSKILYFLAKKNRCIPEIFNIAFNTSFDYKITCKNSKHKLTGLFCCQKTGSNAKSPPSPTTQIFNLQ